MVYGDGAGSFPVQWLICNDDAQNLPFPTAFGSSRSDPTKLQIPKTGEIWEPAPARSVGYLDGWLKGKKICGTPDQWANGFSALTPFIPVGPGGVPLCCQGGVDGAAFDFGFDWGFDS